LTQRPRFAQRRAPPDTPGRPALDRLLNIERDPWPFAPSAVIAPEVERELGIRSARNQRALGWLLVAFCPIVFFLALIGTTNLDPESQVTFTLLVVPAGLLVGRLVLAVRGQRNLRRLG